LRKSLIQQHETCASLRNWAGRGFWAVIDQALFAGANFLVSILLARWLEPAAYGAFSLAYAIFLLLGTVHTGLWTEPMLVYGSGRFREDFAAYQQVLLRYHWRFGGAACLFFLVLHLGFWACGAREIALSVLGLSLAAPTVLYLWLVRRGAYVLLKPRLAALGGGLYLLLYLTQTFFFLRTNTLNTFTALLAMAVASLVSAESIRWRMNTETEQVMDAEKVYNLHWHYGRWALLAGIFSWVPGNIFYLILPAFHGFEAAARFKALMNLLMPILHVNGALGQLLVPGMVRALAQGKLRQFILASLAAFTAFAISYWFLLVTFGSHLLKWIYRDKYLETTDWICWLGLLPVLVATISTISSALRVIEKQKIVAQSYGLISVLTIILGIPLVLRYSLCGSALTLLLVNTLAVFYFYRKAVILNII
jgi:O-antigen/teichoic acid export membrane protein